jgi:aminoglycoside phosphotransferase (APT) family kinase protein
MMAEELNFQEIQARLQTWFDRKMPQADELSLLPLQRDTMGGSNETFFLDLQYREAGEIKREKLVIRWPPVRFKTFPKYDMKEQFLILKHLEGNGVPVPKARWLEEDASIIGRPFYIMDYIEGWIPGIIPPYHVSGPIYEGTPEFRGKVWWEAVENIAKINTIDWNEAGLGFLGIPKSGTGPIDQHIAYYERMLRMNREAPHPILESTMDWLKKNSFVPERVSLCWGDSRLGNFIFRNHEVVGVLDWEMAHLGDPDSDIAWFLHLDLNQYHLLAKPAGCCRPEGLPGREETIEHYQQITNRRVENFFYHDVFAIWRIAVISTRLQTNLELMGYPLPNFDINGYNFERLRSLLSL